METLVHIKTIAQKFRLHDWQVENTLRLFDDGATIPFISRYRKEMTGSLNEVQLTEIRDEYERLKELEKRREAVIKSIEEQEKMTPELLAKINAALTMSQLEDLYLPFRPKRKTRASVARAKGLEPWHSGCLNRARVTLKQRLKSTWVIMWKIRQLPWQAHVTSLPRWSVRMNRFADH